MGRTCSICGRGPITGHRVSKSGKRSKRRWEVNLQRMRVNVEKGTRRLWVCTRCLRSGRVKKALSSSPSF